jgi:peptide/nickel transport system permease protein
MHTYVARRLWGLLLVLWGVSTITFVMLYLIPGDPARMVAGPTASMQAVLNVRHHLGLDRPLYVRYGLWLWRLLHGDLGTSFRYQVPVLDSIVQRLPATAALAVAGLLCELLIGIPIGMLSAVRPHTWLDRMLTVFSLLGITAPQFWLGQLLLYWVAFRWHLAPLGGYGGLAHLVLPAITIGAAGGAWYARILRAGLLEILRTDYIRTARAKGVSGRYVLLRHALPNALLPVVTQIGLDMGMLLSGVLLVEVVYGWPGLGNWAWTAVQNLDFPVVLGTVLVSALLVSLCNLAVDLIYHLLDPRVAYED